VAGDPLPNWRDGTTKSAIIDFVASVDGADGSGVPREERVAVFDNDGTLWREKPMPIQLDFILRRLHEMAEGQPELRDRQPWKSAYGRDYTWLGEVLAAHYAGDDSDLGTVAAGVLAAHGGISVAEFERQAGDLRRPLLAAGNSNGDVPMLEFTTHADAPTLRLLVLHDDAEREFAYTAGAEAALDRTAADGWTVVSMRDDWRAVFCVNRRRSADCPA
jgi:hypothetical protein